MGVSQFFKSFLIIPLYAWDLLFRCHMSSIIFHVNSNSIKKNQNNSILKTCEGVEKILEKR